MPWLTWMWSYFTVISVLRVAMTASIARVLCVRSMALRSRDFRFAGFVGVLDFLESPWFLRFYFKDWKLLEYSCFCYNVLGSPWKCEKHRTFFKLIVLNYVKLLNFPHWWCSDYFRQRAVFVTPNTRAFRYWCKIYSLGGVTVSFFIWYN